MDKTADNPESIASLTRLAFLIPPYGILVASLYGLAYWNSFNINIFELMTLRQLIMASVPAIVYTFILIIIGSTAGIYAARKEEQLKKENKTGGFLFKALDNMARLIIYLLIGLLLGALIAGEYYIAFALSAPILAIYISRPLYNLSITTYLIPDAKTRKIIITIAVLLVTYAYAHGTVNAYQIKTGSSYLSESSSNESNRYIGKAGDFFILYNPIDQSIHKVHITALPKLNLYKCTRNICS